MTLFEPAPVERRPLHQEERETPQAGPGEVLVRVEACGVCRTDLHVAEGDLAPHKRPIVPGHEVVGTVVACGAGATRLSEGERVGVAWVHRTCGTCRFCLRGEENLCLAPLFTGWDVDGGYADFTVAPEAFVHPLPAGLGAREAAPLLCAGIIGYRAYRQSEIPPGGRLGLWGFGGSAHIVIQLARHAGCEVYVFTREDRHRSLAEELGAAWVGGSFEASPHKLDAAILFAPAGELVPAALEQLDRGATLAVAGIHLSQIPALDYERHLFQERRLRSVTANTRGDARALLDLAREIPLVTHTMPYPLAAANEALADLKHDRIRGAAVLEMGA
ncbi:MAG TPA: alcohol dehydrogenase [Deltaproteobacteria bacterium]|jgi:propanol-preferring alcohol dehydrogenase|nr:alcohol dehydrogenase [Deltaproteobacteria bacterium]